MEFDHLYQEWLYFSVSANGSLDKHYFVPLCFNLTCYFIFFMKTANIPSYFYVIVIRWQTGLAWDRVNIPYSSYGTLFFICAEKLLVTEGYFSCCWAVLQITKAFSASHSSPPARRMGMHKNLGGGTAGDSCSQLTQGIFSPIRHHAQ